MDKKQKKPVRRLGLHRETIRELQRDELTRVAGGMASLATTCVNTLPLTVCECTGNYTSQC